MHLVAHDTKRPKMHFYSTVDVVMGTLVMPGRSTRVRLRTFGEYILSRIGFAMMPAAQE